MHVALLALAGLGVGFTVGLTGMGGGALMTPLLVLVFHVQPLAAVSSDLVAAVVMKPVGVAVHARRGTVHRSLVTWLCLGSVPAAFAGVFILHLLGDAAVLQHRIGLAVGVALLLAAFGMGAKSLLARRRGPAEVVEVRSVPVRRVPTVAIGVAGGLIVGMTSVGSGSLMLVLLLMAYPALTSGQLVGTDLAQAIPLVGAAALGHLLFGGVAFSLAGALLLGAIPGVYLGARVSAVAREGLVRAALGSVLALSALKLLGVPTQAIGWVGLGGGGVGAGWALQRWGCSLRLPGRFSRLLPEAVAELPRDAPNAPAPGVGRRAARASRRSRSTSRTP